MAALSDTNVPQGFSAQFIAEFQDANGNLVVPTAATLNIVYPISTTTTTSTAIAMTLTNSFFTATWGSSVSALGIAPWNITSIGTAVPQMQGNLRVIQP